jgi:hypothetical protein
MGANSITNAHEAAAESRVSSQGLFEVTLAGIRLLPLESTQCTYIYDYFVRLYAPQCTYGVLSPKLSCTATWGSTKCLKTECGNAY